MGDRTGNQHLISLKAIKALVGARLRQKGAQHCELAALETLVPTHETRFIARACCLATHT